MSINLNDYYSGGYLILKTEKNIWNDPGLPKEFISLYNEDNEYFPNGWTFDWAQSPIEEKIELAKDFGFKPEQVPEVISCITSLLNEGRIGTWRTIYELDTARNLINKYFKNSNNIHLIGIGLHKDHFEEVIKMSTPPQVPEGFAPYGENGVHVKLKMKEKISAGEVLGFEILSLYGWIDLLNFSWIFEEKQRDALCSKYGVHLNQFGQIDNFSDANKIAADLDKVTYVSGEQTKWFPWLIVRYGL